MRNRLGHLPAYLLTSVSRNLTNDLDNSRNIFFRSSQGREFNPFR